MKSANSHTIEEFITYCYKILALKPEYMDEKAQESPAAGIISAFPGGGYEKLSSAYPEVEQIFDIASNLEISNVDNTTLSWRQIRQLVEDLDRKVHSSGKEDIAK